MMTFFLTAAASSFVFQMILLYNLNRELRIWILSDNMGTAMASLSASILILVLIDAARIVGLAYPFSITALRVL
jgi:hypothetical protein